MKQNNLNFQSLPFEYNNVICKVLFITDSAPFKLVFVKVGSVDSLTLSVVNSFKAVITQDKFNEMRDFFLVSGSYGSWQFMSLIKKLDSELPTTAKLPNQSERKLVARISNVEEADKTLFFDFRI